MKNFTTESFYRLQSCFNLVNDFEAKKLIDPSYSEVLNDEIEGALINVAKAYRYGNGVKRDYDNAIKYLNDAINLGSGNAAKELGNIFECNDWHGKKSYRIDAEECYQLAINLWKNEVANGSSKAAWELYCSIRGESQQEAKKWATIAIERAKKSGDHKRVIFMEDAIKTYEGYFLKK